MQDDCRTYVQPQETEYPYAQQTTEGVLLDTSRDPESSHRHKGWAHQRLLTRHALELAGLRPRKLLAYDLCGTAAWVVRDAKDHTRVRVHCCTCRNRWCLPCARARAFVIAENLRKRLANSTSRKIELTLKSSPDPLEQQMNRLWDCFRVLRKTRFWKDHVAGGAAAFEVTLNTATGNWHPHLHIVFVGKYVCKYKLGELWYRITGDSFVVWVKLVGSERAVAGYVTKYITKPAPGVGKVTDRHFVELIRAFQGRRLVTTFGNWRHFRLTAPLDSTVWEPIAPLEHLMYEARLRHSDAIAILRRLRASDRPLIHAIARARSPTLASVHKT